MGGNGSTLVPPAPNAPRPAPNTPRPSPVLVRVLLSQRHGMDPSFFPETLSLESLNKGWKQLVPERKASMELPSVTYHNHPTNFQSSTEMTSKLA